VDVDDNVTYAAQNLHSHPERPHMFILRQLVEKAETHIVIRFLLQKHSNIITGFKYKPQRRTFSSAFSSFFSSAASPPAAAAGAPAEAAATAPPPDGTEASFDEPSAINYIRLFIKPSSIKTEVPKAYFTNVLSLQF
jgi:hypothetical protein